MSTQQGLRHASWRTIAGISGSTHDGDAMAAWKVELEAALLSVPATFTGRLIAWLQLRTSSAKTNVNDLMAEFAQQQGADNWGAIGTIDPLP